MGLRGTKLFWVCMSRSRFPPHREQQILRPAYPTAWGLKSPQGRRPVLGDPDRRAGSQDDTAVASGRQWMTGRDRMGKPQAMWDRPNIPSRCPFVRCAGSSHNSVILSGARLGPCAVSSRGVNGAKDLLFGERHSTCLEMFSRIPILANVKKSEVPPLEMKGNGIPLVGRRERTTLILKKA